MTDTRKPIITHEDALDEADRIITEADGDRIELRFGIARALVNAAFSGAEELQARLKQRDEAAR